MPYHTRQSQSGNAYEPRADIPNLLDMLEPTGDKIYDSFIKKLAGSIGFWITNDPYSDEASKLLDRRNDGIAVFMRAFTGRTFGDFVNEVKNEVSEWTSPPYESLPPGARIRAFSERSRDYIAAISATARSGEGFEIRDILSNLRGRSIPYVLEERGDETLNTVIDYLNKSLKR